MNHLTDEQLEEIMLSESPGSEHLADCAQCKERLAEKEALANRLRSAFAAVKGSEELAEQIRRQVNRHSSATKLQASGPLLRIRSHWRRWLVIGSVAAALAIAGPIVFYFTTSSPVAAARAELVQIHEDNVFGRHASHEFHSETDPDKLAQYFKDKLGFTPYMPLLDQGTALRGCCVRHFRGQIAGSYVVDTPGGVMSIVVVTDPAESFGTGGRFERDGYVFWKSSFAMCDMVTVRLGDYSYCAVGETSHEYLTELLSRLLP
ncbi:MAG: hypothetical protein ACYSR5_12015 [Planctomycetota bacterium]|jgi:hypothetical protein